MSFTVFGLLCGLCAVSAAALAFFAVPICNRLGLMDVPGDRKLHEKSTPLLGGLTLILVILPTILVWQFLSGTAEMTQDILFCVAATFAMALIGLADDRHSLSARARIILSLFVFGATAYFDPIFNVRVLDFAFPSFRFGLGNGLFADIFTMICCVGLVNAVNMADGKNGLVIGLCIGWLTMLSLRAPAPLLPLILIIMAALTILLIFNLAGRAFLGDGGSYGFACVIALLTIATYNDSGLHGGGAMAAEDIMLLFAIPVADSFRLTYFRMRQGRSPMSADRDHLHHHLQSRFGWPGGLILYLAFAIAGSVTAFLGFVPSSIALLLILLVYACFIVWDTKSPKTVASQG